MEAASGLDSLSTEVVLDDLSMRHLRSLMGENVPVLIGGERHFATVTNDGKIISCVVRNRAQAKVLDFCCDAEGRLLTVDLPRNPADVAFCLAPLILEESGRSVGFVRNLDECEKAILKGLCRDGERSIFLFGSQTYIVSTIHGEGVYLGCTITNEDASFVISFACNLETGSLYFTRGEQHCMFLYDFLAGKIKV